MARELSEAQVRTRLTDRGYTDAAITAAIERLVRDRVIDDHRTAMAVARTEAVVRRHGPHRVKGKLLSLKIDRDVVQDVMSELFGAIDEDQLINTTLDRRLRGRPERLQDPAERRKLIAYLVRQGFSASAASTAVRIRSRG